MKSMIQSVQATSKLLAYNCILQWNTLLIHDTVQCVQTKDGGFPTFCCLNVTRFRLMEDPKSEYTLGVSKNFQSLG